MKDLNKTSLILTIFFSLIAIVFISITIVLASTDPQAWNTGYRVWPGQITAFFQYGNAGGTSGSNFCSRVRNTSGHSYFMPTRTAYEMGRFDANYPPGVDVCCEWSTCNAPVINFSNTSASAPKAAWVNCGSTDGFGWGGCCAIPDSTGEGYFHQVRTGGAGWGPCLIRGNNDADGEGPTADCECRQHTAPAGTANDHVYCGDLTATNPATSCRVQ